MLKTKAPKVEDVRNLENRKKEEIKNTSKRHKEALEKKGLMVDKNNAEKIIKHLKEMFDSGNVSSDCGCSLVKIPIEYCTKRCLEIVNEYLNDEWIASFVHYTENPHDFESESTLYVKPKK